MNRSKFGRHIGYGKSWAGRMPDVTLTMPLDRLAGSPIMGVRGGKLLGGQVVTVEIDPPVGGFAAADLLATFPRDNPAGTIIAVEAATVERTFAPGHWRLRQCFRPPAAAAGLFSRMMVVRNGAVDAPGGSPAAPWWIGRTYSPTVDAGWYYLNEFYSPEPWMIQLLAYTALADANVCMYHLSAEPVHLLDDTSSHV